MDSTRDDIFKKLGEICVGGNYISHKNRRIFKQYELDILVVTNEEYYKNQHKYIVINFDKSGDENVILCHETGFYFIIKCDENELNYDELKCNNFEIFDKNSDYYVISREKWGKLLLLDMYKNTGII